MKINAMHFADAPPVLPLWINGRAFLKVTEVFQDVRNRASNDVVRRVPLCGEKEAALAVESALAACRNWSMQNGVSRSGFLHALGDALATYSEHVTGLIAEESGKPLTAAENEVSNAVAMLQKQKDDCAGPEMVVVVGDSANPLSGALRLAVPLLSRGATVIFRPSPDAPSALFVLAELSGRCGFPAGVVNIIHGGEAVIEALRTKVAFPLQVSQA